MYKCVAFCWQALISCASVGTKKNKKTLHLCCRNAKKKYFCSPKHDLWHFSRKCRKNLNIRTLKTTFLIKSVWGDKLQVVPAWAEEEKGKSLAANKTTAQILPVNISSFYFLLGVIVGKL